MLVLKVKKLLGQNVTFKEMYQVAQTMQYPGLP